MTMNINGLTPNSSGKPKQADHHKTEPKSAASALQSNGPNTADTDPELNVELSSNGKLMHKFEEKINQAPEVDRKKVAYFQQLIQNGQYNVNSESVAQKMLDADNSL